MALSPAFDHQQNPLPCWPIWLSRAGDTHFAGTAPLAGKCHHPHTSAAHSLLLRALGDDAPVARRRPGDSLRSMAPTVVDVLDFRAATGPDQGAPACRKSTLRRDAAEAENAMRLYRSGSPRRFSCVTPEFQTWLTAERESLRSEWRLAALARARCRPQMGYRHHRAALARARSV